MPASLTTASVYVVQLYVLLAMYEGHLCLIMLEQPMNVLSWNVRGLNCPDRRATVHETIAASSCPIVCLQETKLADVDKFTAILLGGNRLRSYAQRPAIGTRGGMLMLWDDQSVDVSWSITVSLPWSMSEAPRLTSKSPRSMDRHPRRSKMPSLLS